MQARLAIVNVETTGSDPVGDRITEIAVLHAEGGALIAQWSTLVNPGRPIPGVIQALTGISPEMVAAAPRFADIVGELDVVRRQQDRRPYRARYVTDDPVDRAVRRPGNVASLLRRRVRHL